MSRTTTRKSPAEQVAEARAELADARQRLDEEREGLEVAEDRLAELKGQVRRGDHVEPDEYAKAEQSVSFLREVVAGAEAKVGRLAKAIPSDDDSLARALAPTFSTMLHGVPVTPVCKLALPRADEVDLSDGPVAFAVQEQPARVQHHGDITGPVELHVLYPSPLYFRPGVSEVRTWRDRAAKLGVSLDVTSSLYVSSIRLPGEAQGVRIQFKRTMTPPIGGPVLPEGITAELAEAVAVTVASQVHVSKQPERVEVLDTAISDDGFRRTTVESRHYVGSQDGAAEATTRVRRAAQGVANYSAGSSATGPAGLIESVELIGQAFPDAEYNSTGHRARSRVTLRAVVVSRDEA